MEIEHFNLWFINNFFLVNQAKNQFACQRFLQKKTNIGFFEGIATNFF
jgi:hypothetical protein